MILDVALPKVFRSRHCTSETYKTLGNKTIKQGKQWMNKETIIIKGFVVIHIMHTSVELFINVCIDATGKFETDIIVQTIYIIIRMVTTGVQIFCSSISYDGNDVWANNIYCLPIHSKCYKVRNLPLLFCYFKQISTL